MRACVLCLAAGVCVHCSVLDWLVGPQPQLSERVKESLNLAVCLGFRYCKGVSQAFSSPVHLQEESGSPLPGLETVKVGRGTSSGSGPPGVACCQDRVGAQCKDLLLSAEFSFQRILFSPCLPGASSITWDLVGNSHFLASPI